MTVPERLPAIGAEDKKQKGVILEKLTSPGVTRAVLAQYGIRARKKYGQNFLTDGNIVRGIVDAANLRPVLTHTLEDCDNVEILWQDILKTDLKNLSDRFNDGKPLKVVANLPYYVTTPILIRLLEDKGRFESITVMVQKEVAERICAGPGSKEYGALSLAVQYYSSPEVVLKVPPACFMPRPAVESAVLYLKAFEQPPVEADEEFLFALIRASFNQRRKTLANGLSHGFRCKGRVLTRQEVEEALTALGLSSDIRGEKLSLEQFAALSRQINNRQGLLL